MLPCTRDSHDKIWLHQTSQSQGCSSTCATLPQREPPGDAALAALTIPKGRGERKSSSTLSQGLVCQFTYPILCRQWPSKINDIEIGSLTKWLLPCCIQVHSRCIEEEMSRLEAIDVDGHGSCVVLRPLELFMSFASCHGAPSSWMDVEDVVGCSVT